MKTLFKNITKFVTVLALVLFAGTAMAANFDTDPAASDNYGNHTGFTSINTFHTNGDNLRDNLTNFSSLIPNYNDSRDVYVFVDFKTASGLITNPRGKITAPLGAGTSSSVTFTGQLSSSNAPTITNSTILSGLPSEYTIDFVKGYNYVDSRQLTQNGSNIGTCDQVYPDAGGFTYYYDDINSSEISNGFILPNDLAYQYAQGWCDQGFVVGKYRITNTHQNAVDTLNVSTQSANVNNNDVTLNGSLNSGNNAMLWFVYGNASQSLNCYNGPQTSFQEGPHDASFAYHYNVNNLAPGNYHYMACATVGSNTEAQGSIVNFHISNNDIIPTNITPEADTHSVGEVTKTTADLRGRIKMNDFNNGLVFFVYDTDENDISNVENSFNNYNEVDSVSKTVVDNNNGVNSWRNYYRSVSGLNTNDRYYYQICVNYYDNGDKIKCGGVENFRTSSNENNNLHIYTREVTDITKTSAKICGSLTNNGNSDIQRWMELRRSTNSTWNVTDEGKHFDSNGGEYCDTLTGLSPDTKYYYRACRTVYTCGVEKYFTTDSNGYIPNGDEPEVTTNDVPLYSIKANSALLPGTFISHANTAQVWFLYGYNPTNLINTTKIYTKYGSGGAYTHNFTNLKSNQRYCYQAVVQTVNGKKYGAVKCFYTLPAPVINNPKPTPKPVITVVKDTKPDIDLSRLGLGISLIRLEINDNKEQVKNGENLTYEITWENVSDIDLNNLDLNISIPNEVQILSSSRGLLDQDKNSIFYTIGNLNAGEKGSMTVNGIVNDGRLGDALTANAIVAFNNPINNAKENAQDYDVDEYTVLTPIGTASVFGLANITLLGWLTILLGLLIIFLVARWLYLEREELRAQAYVNGYGRNQQYIAPVNNQNYGTAPQHVQPVETTTTTHYVAPQQTVQHVPDKIVAPVENAVEKPIYQPYRPNR